MKNKLLSGDTLTFTAPVGGVVSGTPLLMGSLLVVPTVSADAGASFSCERAGVFTLPKASGSAWTVGEKLYWDDTAKAITDTPTNNTLVGVAYVAAGSSDTTGVVLLDGTVR